MVDKRDPQKVGEAISLIKQHYPHLTASQAYDRYVAKGVFPVKSRVEASSPNGHHEAA